MLSRGEITAPDLTHHEKPTGLYTIAPVHSTIGFSVRHAMITDVRAKFTAFEGLLKLDGRRPTRSEAYLSVQAGSLETGSPERDAHVTGPDFLDSASFPLMSFRSTEVRDADDDQFRPVATFRLGTGPEHGTGRRRGPDQRQGAADSPRLRCPTGAGRHRPEPQRDTR
ncbi:YceI family protein [Streptomyces sp. NPDC058086]|uniref:YceI family protein n=1 Tax=Streptomyces sp. NPDC058086 TaxID=3346334 RepID=UPI0036EEBA68